MRVVATYVALWTLVATAVATGIVVGLLVAHAILPDAVAASRAAPESIPAVSRPVAGSVTLDDLAQRGQPDITPAAPTASPAAGRITPSPATSTRAAPAEAPETATTLRGVASTYGPGWDGWLALPQGPGVRVRICGAGGCVVRTSTDAGPSLAMQRAGRIADLDVPTFEAVCGVPWTRGLCRVSVEYP